MALPTPNYANDPNAVYDHGANAAGVGRVTNAVYTQIAIPHGLTKAGVLGYGNIRVGFNAAGVSKNNTGPNAAGKSRVWDYPEGS